jgi:arsenite methyltransferase
MQDYLSYTFNDNEEFISTFDEISLWSAPFGLLLLKNLELKRNMKVLDLGSGTGFPLLELAARSGNSCTFYGIDPWKNANKRAREKINNYGLKNVELIESSADKIPFADNSIDLIVSNLGINNFENPAAVFRECNRVLKPEAKLVLTTNLKGHWKELYLVFEATLRQLEKENLISILKADEEHRGTVESVSAMFTENGFIVSRQEQNRFEMKFLDGTSFLNHHFIKLGWLSTWMKIFPENELPEIFTALEKNLNAQAETGELILSVPMLFMEGKKL